MWANTERAMFTRAENGSEVPPGPESGPWPRNRGKMERTRIELNETMAAYSSLSRRTLHGTLAVVPKFPLRSLHEGPDTIDELLDRHLVKKKKKTTTSNGDGGDDDDDEELALRQRRLTSTRREALALYRDILRATRFFAWPDARGVPWRDVLRANARREFEEARFERDPEVVAKLLIGGRDAVQKALDRLVDASKKMVDAEARDRSGGGT
ncbi:uncharacterized protein LOC109713563 [Ananas comosus]|uniref:Uncharacterized protein LOC109713563 n=1 Tax=Ananas comosus TaxID=4615 RepID=A0A6P5FAM2_ANACO|nr:uncharacterized protein LOC109713563 [Ananas comosus]